MIPYNVNSPRAEEFINHQEILDTLEYAKQNKSNRALIEGLIQRATTARASAIGRLRCFWNAKSRT